MKQRPLKLPTEYQEKLCGLFAGYSYSTSTDEYSRRGQNDSKKITDDIYRGKLAEFMVHNMFLSKGRYCTLPDLGIYNEKNKSFDCDLTVGDNKVHVKSHQVNEHYPVSWLFQATDPLVLFPNKNDFIALCVIGIEEPYMYLIKADEVVYKQPIKEALKKTKVCVYEQDLI